MHIVKPQSLQNQSDHNDGYDILDSYDGIHQITSRKGRCRPALST
jgi:hypothetical protein